MIPIETDALFAVPYGRTKIPQEICDVIKTCEGSRQHESKSDCFNVIDDHPKIKSDLTDIFTLWVNSVNGTPEQKWALTTSWVTLNPDGTRMETHRHLNCAYSAVLYFDTVDTAHSPLEFHNPLSSVNGSFLLREAEHDKRNVFNARSVLAMQEEGVMFFFPAYIFHGHLPFTVTDTVRKSFACNFVPTGKFGQFDSTLDTQWMQ